MPKYKKPNRELLLQEVNPFLTTLVVPVRERTEYRKGTSNTLEPHTYLADNSKSIKMFTGTELRKLKAQLSFKAAHLLLWIMEEIMDSDDFVTINVKRYLEESNEKLQGTRAGSLTTYKSAALELRKVGILSPTTAHETYFINPALFFKGNRVRKYPNHIKQIFTKKEKQEASDDEFLTTINK